MRTRRAAGSLDKASSVYTAARIIQPARHGEESHINVVGNPEGNIALQAWRSSEYHNENILKDI